MEAAIFGVSAANVMELAATTATAAAEIKESSFTGSSLA